MMLIKQIDAMDSTREMVESWDDLPPAFPYWNKVIVMKVSKVIKRELLWNVGLALAAVAVSVFCTVASPVTSLLITVNVACCLAEILGFMWTLGIAIDSVSVINLVLAVGLSVDYSAHVGHCFIAKGGLVQIGVIPSWVYAGRISSHAYTTCTSHTYNYFTHTISERLRPHHRFVFDKYCTPSLVAVQRGSKLQVERPNQRSSSG